MAGKLVKTSPLVWVVLLALCGRSVAAESDSSRFAFAEGHMGTRFVVTLYAASEAEAQRTAAAAFDRIGELDDRLSDYKPESELSRLSRSAGGGQAVRVSEDLWNVLRRAEEVSQLSSGAFDVTVGPYVRLWRRARRTGQMPSETRLDEARDAVGHGLIRFNEAEREIELTRAGMRLDLGAIAKGYAADEALQAVREAGISAALIDAGGDLAVGDPPPGEAGWRIATAPVGDRGQRTEVGGQGGEVVGQVTGGIVLHLANCGVATSGDAYQYVEFEGKRYSHILDPRTGIGVTTPSSVTVVARDCTTADAWASAVSVLGPQALELLQEVPKAAALIVRLEDGRERRYMSPGMEEFFLREDEGRSRRDAEGTEGEAEERGN